MKAYLLAAVALLAATLQPAARTVDNQPVARTVDYRTIPLPASIAVDNAAPSFTLGATVTITAPDSLQGEAALLRSYLPDGLKGASSGAITLAATLDDANPEAYTIDVTSHGITINGATAAGTFRGIMTLRKSLPAVADGAVTLPAAHIYDKPRFGYRGCHFDVSRHFFDIDEVKSFIDMIALHGVNTFHWHLTDDQGWRIEIKKYPRLTQVGQYRPHSILGRTGPDYDTIPVQGFYTRDQAREVVQYAAARHIQVIPEIDLPSHMQAALASYPELGCTGGPYEVWGAWGVSDQVLCPGNDKTMEFLKDVIDEVCAIFPAPYFHIGGDECPRTEWVKCPRCQARIKELGIEPKNGVSAEAQLQGYVTRYACDIVHSHGKQAIGWDEILECEEIPSDAIIMSWRGVRGAEKGTARGHRTILTPTSHCYFDFYQSEDISAEPFAIGGLTPVEKVYDFDPILTSMTPQQQQLVMGCQSNLWCEYIASLAHAQYMELPRLAALCEVQWLDPSLKDYEDFKRRLPSLLDIYDKEGYNYARHIFNPQASYDVDSDTGTLKVSLSSMPGYTLTYTTDGTEPTPRSAPYDAPLSVDKAMRLRANAFTPAGEPLRAIDDSINPGPIAFSRCKLAVNADKGYRFKGAPTLVDGLWGNENFRTGRWLGFQGNDCDATIRLKQPMTVGTVAWNNCIGYYDGVLDCRGVEVYGSNDGGKTFTLLAAEDYPLMEPTATRSVARHAVTFEPREVNAIRVLIKGQHILPDGHPFAGSRGYVFVDEITAH